MNRKVLAFSLLVVVSVVVLAAVSAVAVFALVGDSPARTEEVSIDGTFEVAPVQVEAPGQVEVVKPVLTYERAGHSGRAGGCPYSHAAKQQLTQAPGEPLETEPLAQIGP